MSSKCVLDNAYQAGWDDGHELAWAVEAMMPPPGGWGDWVVSAIGYTGCERLFGFPCEASEDWDLWDLALEAYERGAQMGSASIIR